MSIHVLLLRLGFHSDVFALNTLLNAYLTCGCTNTARKVFDEMPKRDVVAWTMLMNGYVRNGRGREAIELFFSMRKQGVRSDGRVLVAVFNACGQVNDLSLARELETSLTTSVEVHDIHVMNALISMYAKCGSMEGASRIFNSVGKKDTVTWNSMVSGYASCGMMSAAREVFYLIPIKNEVSWSTLVNGYVQNGSFGEALNVFNEMRGKGLVGNNAAFTSAITACGHLGSFGLALGREIHSGMDEQKVLNDVILSTALVDMYAKCGCLKTSTTLFERMKKKKSLVTWNVMIMGMATHGNAPGCFDLFTRLLKEDLTPSGETFLGLLLGCAHAGWVDEGRHLFVRMTCIYGITPQIEHCSCMVQLIGQAGLLAEAYEFIQKVSVTPDATLWGALLTACNFHGDVQLGELVSRKILELEPLHTGVYVQLSSMYAKAGMWREVMEIRFKMKEMGIKNRPARSSFELDGTVHEFFAGEDSHPMTRQIISVLNGIDILLNGGSYQTR